ncbi:MAG: beta-N-acetylhexosaminidase, partial [Melioribacteraceae bacterium]
MKKFSCTILVLLFSITLTVQSQPEKTISIIPRPVKLEIGKGVFKINSQTKIWLNEPSEELQKLGGFLSEAINNSTGLKLSATAKMTREIPVSLILVQIKKDFPSAEWYSLDILPHKITITASGGSGVFYAIQSLLQLMPAGPMQKNISVPSLSIEDSPRFEWRGVHLDVCRHFFSADFVKKYIDILAMYKINRFHWHLTDDQGWRIEIKKYPRLTEIGGRRKESMGDKKPHGGFYTQDQIREIVNYAKDRFITVVPEIEMPGHALAALAAYPELSCTGGPFEVETTWGVFDDVFCPGNDKVFDFLEDVLTEALDLFPSEYIHIGGDECPKERWKECPKCQARIKTENLQDELHLQSYFVQRI